MNTSDKAQKTERPDIMELIKTNDEYTIGALMTLYSYQTSEEQLMKYTRNDNAMGFNSMDAGVLSDIAEFYRRTGFLTEKQINFARRTIMKYHRQLTESSIRPLPIKSKTKEQTTNVTKWAGSLDGGKKILIKFKTPKDDPQWRQLLEKVKTLSGRRWNPDLEDKPWSCHCTMDNLQQLIDWGFEIAPKLKEWHDKMSYKPIQTDLEIEGLGMELYPFQKQGVAFIESRNGRALIGDEMGLGKTAQALAWLQLNKENALPTLIVCPASVKLNWLKECAMWVSDLSVQIISGRNAHHIGKADIIISNYDILSSTQNDESDDLGWPSMIMKTIKPKTLIVDEVHYIKNTKALRSKAIRKMAKGIKNVIGLSGTPIVNRPVEFFNSLNLIAPQWFPSFWAYAHRYCNAKHNGYGWDFSGSSNTEELHQKATDSVMIRRKKEEVLNDLPPKIRCVIPMEIDNEKEYKKANRELTEWVKNEYYQSQQSGKARSGAEALTKIEELKQITIKGKMDGIIQWIGDFLETGQKLVVFCTHHKTIDDLISHFKDSIGTVKLDGRDNLNARQAAIDAFQTLDNIRLFIGNIKAAGIGITLTAASATCFVELPWTPGDADQAEDRIHRIGQKADSVMAYYLLAQNTIEEDIAELIDTKRKILDQILDGQETDERSMLSELLERMINK